MNVAQGLVPNNITGNIFFPDIAMESCLQAQECVASVKGSLQNSGEGKTLNEKASCVQRGTLDYMAWELFAGYGGGAEERYLVTSAVDIFSFGVMLWELVTHERPNRSQGALRQLR